MREYVEMKGGKLGWANNHLSNIFTWISTGESLNLWFTKNSMVSDSGPGITIGRFSLSKKLPQFGL